MSRINSACHQENTLLPKGLTRKRITYIISHYREPRPVDHTGTPTTYTTLVIHPCAMPPRSIPSHPCTSTFICLPHSRRKCHMADARRTGISKIGNHQEINPQRKRTRRKLTKGKSCEGKEDKRYRWGVVDMRARCPIYAIYGNHASGRPVLLILGFGFLLLFVVKKAAAVV